MFYLNLIEIVSAIEMIRVIIIIKDVFLISFAARIKIVLNILN